MNIAPTAALRKQARHRAAARHRRFGPVAIAMMLAMGPALPLAAQQDSDPPASPAPAPSPSPSPAPSTGSGYSLPPGTSTTPRPDAAQGPSDESSPPRTISPDRPAATPIPAPVTAPVASIPAPETRATPGRSTPERSANERNADQPAPRTATNRPAQAAPGDAAEARQTAPAQPDDDNQPSDGGQADAPLTEAPPVPMPEADPGFQTRPPVVPDSVNAEPGDNESWPMLFALAAALSLIVVASVILILRRKPRPETADAPIVAETVQDEPPAPEPAVAQSAPLPDPPSEQDAPAPDPVAAADTAESAQDGAPLSDLAGVTGAASSPRQPETAPAGAAPNVSPSRLAVDFAVTSGEMTLINTIITYRLTLGNIGKEALSDLAIHGLIVQARRESPSQIPPAKGAELLPLIERMARLPVGISDTIEGELRLPLDRIDPIRNGNRILLVPLVYIWVGYDTPDGARFAVSRSFVVGEESDPPGDKVGPLRLDPGPRRFTAIGQRPLIAG